MVEAPFRRLLRRGGCRDQRLASGSKKEVALNVESVPAEPAPQTGWAFFVVTPRDDRPILIACRSFFIISHRLPR